MFIYRCGGIKMFSKSKSSQRPLLIPYGTPLHNLPGYISRTGE